MRPPYGRSSEHAHSYPWAFLDAFDRYRERVMFLREGRPVLTYGEAYKEVFRLARALAERGLRRGDGVAVLAADTPGTILAQLAAQLIGCYYVRLNVLEAGTKHMTDGFAEADAKALVFDPLSPIPPSADLLERAPLALSLGPSPMGADLLETAARQSPAPMPAHGRDDDPGELVFTSGSTTGRPKLACYTFERLTALTRYWEAPTDRADPELDVFHDSPPCTLLAFPLLTSAPGMGLMPTLLHGGRVVLTHGFDTGDVLKAIERDRVTVARMVPTRLYRLLDHPDLATTDLSSLRSLIYFGAPIAQPRLREALSRLGPILAQSYGLNEARMVSVLHPADHVNGRPEVLRSAGRPRNGVEVTVRDREGNPVPTGSVGELWVRSPYAMNGYWQQPELTSRTVTDGWIRTGDLGHVDQEGYLYLVDRLRDMAFVEGTNCYTREVEDVLSSHPAVRHVSVVGLPDEETGEALHAAVVGQPGAAVSEEELRALVRAEKSRLHAPRTIVFLDEIPLTPVGKPDKQAVRQYLAQRLRNAEHGASENMR
ncbi:AMP-binding protein [Streptomyces monashensis]|uniref:AMP-binding protein n=1 Tax=Streptomyces monashensis TaxID=1678012 RepID=UPI0033FDEAB0